MEHENSKRSAMLLQAKRWNGGSDDTANSSDSSIPTPKFSKVAAQAFADARKKVHLKRTTRNKVMESWDLLKDDLQGLGMDFFIQMFKDYPHLRELFPFGPDIVTEADMRRSKMLQHHALLAMDMLGRATMGLSDMQVLIPKLRQLGRLHTVVGVKAEYYDDVYHVLIQVIKKKVGKSKWSNETEQAWESVYDAIVSVMKDPSRHLDVEPPEGWGLYHSSACLYLAIATPFRLGGFGGVVQKGSLTAFLNILDFIAVAICGLDAFGEHLEIAFRAKGRVFQLAHHDNQKDATINFSSIDASAMLSRLSFPVRFRLYRLVQRLNLSRWGHWRVLDLAIMASYAFVIVFNDLLSIPVIQERNFVTLWRVLAFTIGLIRCAALMRVVHFVRCAEMFALKEAALHRDQFIYVQIGKMMAFLAYAIHLFGCLFSMVAQLEGLSYLEPSFFTDGRR